MLSVSDNLMDKRVSVFVREKVRVCVRKKEGERVRVCVLEKEREREFECVFEREKEGERES